MPCEHSHEVARCDPAVLAINLFGDLCSFHYTSGRHAEHALPSQNTEHMRIHGMSIRDGEPESNRAIPNH